MTARRDAALDKYLALGDDGHIRLHPDASVHPTEIGAIVHHDLGYDEYTEMSSWLGADDTEHLVLPQLLKLHAAEGGESGCAICEARWAVVGEPELVFTDEPSLTTWVETDPCPVCAGAEAASDEDLCGPHRLDWHMSHDLVNDAFTDDAPAIRAAAGFSPTTTGRPATPRRKRKS